MVERIEVSPAADPVATVIWLHGLGADGHDFEPIVPHLKIPAKIPVRFVFPHAPVMPVTINMGMRMRAWYDITNPVIGMPAEDRVGIEAAAQIVRDLILEQNNSGIATSRIILAGFSQGGAIALFAGLRHHEQLAGIMALSSYLPLAATTEVERNLVNQDTPIFFGHGMIDPVISIQVAEQSSRLLNKLQYEVDWHTYAMMAHSVSPEEIEDIGNWLTKRLDQMNGAEAE